MSKLLYTYFTKLIIVYILSHNKSIPRKPDSKLHNSQDDNPITKLLSTTNGDYKFGMEVPDAMISDVIKKKASGRGKGFMCYADQVEKVPNKLKKDVVPRKTRSLTIAEEAVVGELANYICIQEPRSQRRRRNQLTIDSQLDDTVADMYNEWGQKLKGPVVEDSSVQSLLDLWKGSKASRLESLRQKKQPFTGEGSSAAHNKYYSSSDTASDATLYSSSSDKSEESANETDDADKSDIDLFDDNPHGDDDTVRYEVFMHNKSTATPNSTYLSPTVTSSSLDFIQTLLDETLVNELTGFMSHLVYTYAHTTLVVHYPEGNPELTSYISGNVPRRECSSHTISTSKENSLSYNNSIIKLLTRQSKEADAKGEKEYEEDQLQEGTFEKSVQAKVLTEIKKLLPTHIPNVIVNYVRPRLNTSVLEVMKNNQINLFTQSSTSTNDLLYMDLKIKLLNKIHSNKSNKTHTTHQQLYDTLYESITLDQDALDAQASQLSFHKRSHDNQDPPNNREGKNKKKRRKDVSEPSSRSSRQNRSPVVIVQDDTPTMQPLDKADILIQKQSKPEWFPKKSGLAKRRTTCQLPKATILLEAQWNSDEGDVSKPRSFERHMSKSTKPHPCFYNNDYTYLVDLSIKEKYTTYTTKHYAVRNYTEGIEDRFPERWSKEVHRYHFEALNGIHHWKEDRIDLFKAGMSVVTKGNVYSDLRIKSVVRIVVKKKWGYGFLTSIVVRRSDDKEYEFSYADLPRLSVNNVEDIRTVIKNRVEDIQLGVESYQSTLNLNKPTMFFEGINQRIPFTMTEMHKGVVYLNQYNIKSLMKLSEVKKFCDGILVKIQENLINMLSKNKLGSGNKRLKGRDWIDYDVNSSKDMLKKIDEILRHREQLRRLEEYVGGRHKTVNPRTFVRPL
ncbi:hypothetical protein Tco_0725740 [Tanacetum coccineum]|uniref:Uncharacterized protein n=1 Tax=Tanacetum coccineum TaxID=301880 RepID=A0ABQ4YDS5_9ASTR